MKSVRDIMSPIVFCLEDTSFLPEAAQSLRKHAITGAPVVTSEGEYVGVLSQTDINAQLAKTVDKSESFEQLMEGGLPEDLHSIQVRDIMTPEIFKISVDASLEELGQALLIAGVHRFLVADGEETVGLVTTTDLIHGFLSPEGSSVHAPKRPTRKPYLFETELDYEDGLVRMKGAYGSELDLEPSPEFGGSGRYASPEDLFVAAISSCLCLTFMEFAKRQNLKILNYTCRAIGRLEGDGVSLRFTRVDLYPKVQVVGTVEQTEKVLMQAKLRCLVGRSADVITVLHPTIDVETLQEI